MKNGLKFIGVYSIATLVMFCVAKLFVKELTMEMFAYLGYYYLLTLSLGLIVYPFVNYLLEKSGSRMRGYLTISIIFFVVLVNIVPFVYDNGRILSLNVLQGLFLNHSLLGFNNLGIHAIAIVSYIISYSMYGRNWQPLKT